LGLAGATGPLSPSCVGLGVAKPLTPYHPPPPPPPAPLPFTRHARTHSHSHAHALPCVPWHAPPCPVARERGNAAYACEPVRAPPHVARCALCPKRTNGCMSDGTGPARCGTEWRGTGAAGTTRRSSATTVRSTSTATTAASCTSAPRRCRWYRIAVGNATRRTAGLRPDWRTACGVRCGGNGGRAGCAGAVRACETCTTAARLSRREAQWRQPPCRYCAGWDTVPLWDTVPGGIPCRVGYHAGWDTVPCGIPCRMRNHAALGY
jgi:hypothetical protein